MIKFRKTANWLDRKDPPKHVIVFIYAMTGPNWRLHHAYTIGTDLPLVRMIISVNLTDSDNNKN